MTHNKLVIFSQFFFFIFCLIDDNKIANGIVMIGHAKYILIYLQEIIFQRHKRQSSVYE